jgi:hypothetical protein
MLFSLLFAANASNLYFHLYFHVLGLIISIWTCLIKGLSLIVSEPYTSSHLEYSRV